MCNTYIFLYILICMLLLLSRFSRVRLCVTPQTAAHQAPPSLGFSRQEHWSGLPFPSPMQESEKWKWKYIHFVYTNILTCIFLYICAICSCVCMYICEYSSIYICMGYMRMYMPQFPYMFLCSPSMYVYIHTYYHIYVNIYASHLWRLHQLHACELISFMLSFPKT